MSVGVDRLFLSSSKRRRLRIKLREPTGVVDDDEIGGFSGGVPAGDRTPYKGAGDLAGDLSKAADCTGVLFVTGFAGAGFGGVPPGALPLA